MSQGNESLLLSLIYHLSFLPRKRKRYDQHGVALDYDWKVTFVNHLKHAIGHDKKREFEFTRTLPFGYESSVIYHFLRNTCVRQMLCARMMTTDFKWTVDMLRGLHENTHVEELRMLVLHRNSLHHIGRFDEGMQLRRVKKLRLTVNNRFMRRLTNEFDFFGLPSIQQLTYPSLNIEHRGGELEADWTQGLYKLPNCRHLEVRYEPERYRRGYINADQISFANLECNGIEISVERFTLRSAIAISEVTGGRMPAHRHVDVPAFRRWKSDDDRYDVRYYETSDRTKCLTLFVRRDVGVGPEITKVIHVKRGRINSFDEF
ncbi:hypothetical protein AAVH_09682 [Aphelenchoides avenae]|nr:hypothetical protein AAVH_09682 [Aphelenchus avenae]